MFFKKDKVKVVTAAEQTDFAERFEALERKRSYATKKDVALMAGVPTVGAIGLVAYNKYTSIPSNSLEVQGVQNIQQTIQPSIEPITALTDTYSSVSIPVNAIPQQTGLIADKSLEMLATILDPVVQVLMAISFPVASVIMIGACFFFMFGNSERAWSMIMNAGLGYVLIQLSPLFLDILRTVGKAV